MLGNPARLDELKAIADEHGLILLEDAAQAFGASYKGRKVGSIGNAGTYSFNIFKTITGGDGGMVVTDDDAIYRRCFAFHDQGHSPLRMGVEVGKRPFIGLDFRMTELTGAVVLAQFRKVGQIVSHLHANKRRLKKAITAAGMPDLQFREITDLDGECGTLLTVFLPSETVARQIAGELGTKVIADSGWHVYSNMEQILDKRMPTAEGWPDTHPLYVQAGGKPVEYRRGMLPQTDDLLSRAINISVGVWDAGLGSGFGVKMSDGFDAVDRCAEEFCHVAKKHLG
jgi:8-amino-3,8-dideoxy-alpha-D-manno-octulosonate transaminase